jgi:glutamyl-tRNA synthetase
MHAVVVDDHDMGVTHVIRGDDHLANAARQMLVYRAMGWQVPVWAHVPLILGPDGKKMSKRHGATGVHEYEALGYPAPAMRNYLARLGWSHGDQEVFTDSELKALFDVTGINRAPARFDFKKLESISGHHIAMMDDAALLQAIDGYLAARDDAPLSATQREGLRAAMPHLKERAKTLGDLLDKAHFVLGSRPFTPDEKAAKALDPVSRGILDELTPHLRTANWARDALEETVASFAEAREMKLGKIAQPLRAALSGRTVSPSVFDMMMVLGRDETLGRLEDAAGTGGD